jgi:transcription antitermination factor NusG
MPILERENSIFPDELLFDAAFGGAHPDRRWWTILTRARNEKALARHLFEQKIPYYLPLVPKRNRVRNRVVHSHIPVFGGYVFLFGDEYERQQSMTTNRVSAVIDVFEQDQLRGDLVQLYQLIESGEPLTVEQRLQPGQAVRIKSGSLRGIEGVITDRRGGKQRLLVAVHYLNQGVSLEIDDFMVEPI